MIENIELDQLQADVKTRLAAHAYFSGVDIFIEDDPEATAEQTKEQTALEEGALEEDGLAVQILSPEGLGQERVRGRVAIKAAVGIAIVEDPLVNRKSTGLRKPPLRLIKAAIAALAGAYEFPDQTYGGALLEDGLKSYVLIATRQCIIAAE